MRYVLLFFLCCAVLVLGEGSAPPEVEVLIRFHGDRIHIKLVPKDHKFHAHVTGVDLCSSVDLNIGEKGCHTSGFVSENVLSRDADTTNKFDARFMSSGSGLSVKPVPVIDNWPLVYVELQYKVKESGKGWVDNGKVFRQVARVDRQSAKAGRALGMNIPESDKLTWQWTVAIGLTAIITLFAVASFVQRKIVRATRRASRQREYSPTYSFDAQEDEATCAFLRSKHKESLHEQRKRTERELREKYSKIAADMGTREADEEEWGF